VTPPPRRPTRWLTQLKRTHFHDFMLDVHGRLRRLAAQSDPLARVADDIAEDIKVHDAVHSFKPTPGPGKGFMLCCLPFSLWLSYNTW